MAITNFDIPVTPFWKCSISRNSRHSYGDIPIKENHNFVKNPTILKWFCKAECLTREYKCDFVDLFQVSYGFGRSIEIFAAFPSVLVGKYWIVEKAIYEV